MQLTEHFKNTLPNKPYCADDIGYGLKIKPRNKALLSQLIQYNGPGLAHWLAMDIDSQTAGMDWYDLNGPVPNFIVQNPANGHAHYLFGLSAPVCLSGKARPAPMRYLAGIEHGLTLRLGADQGYSGLVSKNPLNSYWRTFTPRLELYSLDELADYCDLSQKTVKQREIRGYGRNVELFDRLRFQSYDKVEKARSESTEQAWLADVTANAMSFNAGFADPLSFSEMAAIARSVAKWTWKHYDSHHDGKNRGVLGYGSNRANGAERDALGEQEIKQRQQAGARYTTATKKASREAEIKKAIAQLKLEGKRLTVASVARLTGVHRNTISRYYKHLIS